MSRRRVRVALPFRVGTRQLYGLLPYGCPNSPRHGARSTATSSVSGTLAFVAFCGFTEKDQTDFLARFMAAFGTVNLEAADACRDLNRLQATMLSLNGMTDPLQRRPGRRAR